MRKLLIFMFVFGLVSSANAVTITFDASAEPACTHGYDRDVTPGDVVTIEITSDTAVTTGYLVSITESTTSTAGDATAALGALHTGFNFNPSNGNLRNATTNYGAGTARLMLIDRISGGINEAPSIAAGQVLYSFALTIPSEAVFCDTFTITAAVGFPAISPPPAGYTHALDAGAVTTTDVVLHVVPEPMTIVLLGLGGLLLRRRK